MTSADANGIKSKVIIKKTIRNFFVISNFYIVIFYYNLLFQINYETKKNSLKPKKLMQIR
jgi:hypothetical protein